MHLTLPDELQVPVLHSQDQVPDEQLTAYGRLVCVEARLTWFVLELAPDHDTFSAYLVDSQNEQFGYFSFAYLERILPPTVTATYEELIPTPLQEVVLAERARRHLAYGERRSSSPALAAHRAYYVAADYPAPEARQVTNTVRAIFRHHKVNLSVFCLIPGVTAQLVILGDRPAEPIHDQIMEALQGKPLITINYEVLMELFKTKREENQRGEWREHHTHVKIKRKQKKMIKRF